ncbi:type VI secretion IcmF C-terminal domain-containing protein [Limnobacter sp. CACIAM 66H1]|uniref:type VI secretion IcmF C-terminal domain-containing protein n=1 Tax=Limnobacter sp. CACIAM 66H1 TaxID=1813033 RepID=UPI00345CC1C0
MGITTAFISYSWTLICCWPARWVFSRHQGIFRTGHTSRFLTTTLRVRASEGNYKTYNGPWALFRLFDAAQIQNTERPEKFRATFNLDGKQFEFEVLANSAFNPLRLTELKQFRCPGNL